MKPKSKNVLGAEQYEDFPSKLFGSNNTSVATKSSQN